MATCPCRGTLCYAAAPAMPCAPSHALTVRHRHALLCYDAAGQRSVATPPASPAAFPHSRSPHVSAWHISMKPPQFRRGTLESRHEQQREEEVALRHLVLVLGSSRNRPLDHSTARMGKGSAPTARFFSTPSAGKAGRTQHLFRLLDPICVPVFPPGTHIQEQQPMR